METTVSRDTDIELEGTNIDIELEGTDVEILTDT